MRKFLVLLASATLLLVGCAKEKFAEPIDGGLTNVTFTVSLDNSVATKAAVDGDGAAASVNRCIMEIYYGSERYTRKYAPVGTDKKATFTVQVVSNRTYTVAFWADKVDATTEAGLKVDKYYTTDATGGLQAITINGSYLGNDDARDAFFYVGNDFTVAQTGTSWNDIKLKRPFAQVNVITTDLQIIKPVPALKPEGIDVLVKNAYTGFNVLTETVSTPSNLTYTAALYKFPETIGTQTDATLSMDYLFAPADKAVIDIDWKAQKDGNTDVKHAFAAVPYQRNYRTNIKGALLTATGKWTVTVEPTWTTPAYDVPYLAASTIEEAQNYIAPTTEGTQTTKVVDLSKATIKTTDITGEDKKIEFRLKTTSPIDMVNFTLPAIPADVIQAGCTGWKITHDPNYPTENVNVTAPNGTSVTIDAPSSHVTLNGAEYEQVTASTGDNTLVVPKGVTIDSLIVKKGAVEIHGAVGVLKVSPEEYSDGSIAKVVFRACEGLSATVFEKIYKEGGVNYIDPMYAYELVDEKYNIYKLPVVAMIGDVEYPSIAAAVAAAEANDVIDVVAESVEMPKLSKADITVKGNGTTKVTKFGGLSGKNVTLDGFEFTVETNPSGENFVIKNSKFTGTNGLRWAYAYGEVLIENCIFDTKTYGIHFDSNTGGIVTVKNCEITGFNTFNPLLIFDNCKFVDSKIDNKYYVVQSWSNIVIKNCSFSEKWCDANDYQTIGLTTKTGLAEISNCTFATGTVYDACKNSELGVIAIDATGNATDGFTAGTFMAKQASDIKVAGLNEVVPVEGKENVFTIAPKQFDETTVAFCNGVEYETIEAALDAASQAKGGEITLVSDYTISENILFNGAPKSYKDGEVADCSQKYILDLNGHKIYSNGKTFTVENCQFNLKDSANSGSIENESNAAIWLDGYYSKTLNNCATLNIYGGTYRCKESDIDSYAFGAFNHKFGVSSSGKSSDGYTCAKKLNIYGGNFAGLSCDDTQVNIYGGYFTRYIYLGMDERQLLIDGLPAITMSVYGGVFDLQGNIKEMASFALYDAKTERLHIYAGDFNFDPTAYVMEGSKVEKVGDRWIVTQNN